MTPTTLDPYEQLFALGVRVRRVTDVDAEGNPIGLYRMQHGGYERTVKARDLDALRRKIDTFARDLARNR